ncbi:Ankyrin repeat family protein, putative [Theobroma cacao]|uniref:Ankyrin repeat family protein, putative n=1 Tax=Theobroma cacao TaxID=3641 RepID=A0A061DJD5_THECC|nr:Ankyrin repeat family protein, putative [Theobroma cacao]
MRPPDATYGAPKRSTSKVDEKKDLKDAYIRYLPLYKAVDSGDLEATKKFLDQHPSALTSSLSADGDTALHIAVLAGHVEIVEELVGHMSAQEIAVKQKFGSTALNFAAVGGIPLVVAALYGHRDLVQYLYKETPMEELDPTNINLGPILLTACIINEFYDIALDLVQRYPQLAIAEDIEQDTALHSLAQKPSAFPSGTQLETWQWWIYKFIQLHPHNASLYNSGDIEKPHEGPTHPKNLTKRGVTSIYELKLKHVQAKELLNLCLPRAAERQEKIFSHIYRTGAKKNYMATHWDKDSNNMLHQAAFLAPSSQLDRVSGAALQMQRELQWFKEVESVVQPKYREMVNNHFKTPRALFTDQHQKLVEQGEQWTKETAESCTVVTALIVTIVFSAVFTVPGGYDEAGVPLYLLRSSFLIFIISDALSLFTSTTSLLMFLGILTSRYREEDFLQTVPTKLMIGLSMLFFSLATMMIAFGVAIRIVLNCDLIRII